MSPREDPVPRPLRRSEYRLVFATRQAAKGWTDLLATTRNGARIWFFVEGDVVHLLDVHTHHPNQTKR